MFLGGVDRFGAALIAVFSVVLHVHSREGCSSNQQRRRQIYTLCVEGGWLRSLEALYGTASSSLWWRVARTVESGLFRAWASSNQAYPQGAGAGAKFGQAFAKRNTHVHINCLRLPQP